MTAVWRGEMSRGITEIENETQRKIKFDQETDPDACVPAMPIPAQSDDDRLTNDTDRMRLKMLGSFRG
jgi:hypothetical protein